MTYKAHVIRVLRVARVIEVTNVTNGTRLAIAMQKGGVGKTTTTINTAGALANRGHDVLAIDADPQGGLTLKLGMRNHYRNSDRSLFEVLSDQGTMSLDDLDELVVEYDEFDVVPAQLKNFILEKALYTEAGGHESLKKAINRMERSYDYVLIDSPPNLGPLSDGALLAAENVLFPSHPNQISQDSIWLLRREIATLEDKFNIDIRSIAAVLNEVPTGESVSMSVQNWFNDTFGEENVFEVGDRAAVEHAIQYRTSLFAYDPEDAGYSWDQGPVEELRDTYDQLAQRVEERL